MKKLIIFASGKKDPKEGGGSGFQKLVENSRTGVLRAEIVAVVSNHENGSVRELADNLGVRFVHFPEPREVEDYQRIVAAAGADFVAFSGWLKLAKGLDPAKTINIHPGKLPRFGGTGMFGHHVHEAVIEAFRRGEVKLSAVTMHFVTEKYDEGPTFFEYPVYIYPDDTADTLAERVNRVEHGWQSFITDLVVNDEISWDGKDPKTLKVPKDYRFLSQK